MKLKIGDKVRIKDIFQVAKRVGKVHEVCQVAEDWDYESEFICRVREIDGFWSCLMFEQEIEKVVTKGQQLLFSFME